MLPILMTLSASSLRSPPLPRATGAQAVAIVAGVAWGRLWSAGSHRWRQAAALLSVVCHCSSRPYTASRRECRSAASDTVIPGFNVCVPKLIAVRNLGW
ncbi:hypothetical protein AAHA92_21856 [Salvia divinorum]|uniref:Secreted protein n=1 Tax=Salvia divinorum TaxID=28513 RepID=A0ABD1GPR4_SALDI